MNDDDYYRIRESGLGFDNESRASFSVAIVLGQSACASAVGQSVALNLINILLRFINNVTIAMPADRSDLLVKFPFVHGDFAECLRAVAERCDPRATMRLVSTANFSRDRSFRCYSIGIGPDTGAPCDLYLSASVTPPIENLLGQVLVGAGVAALLGAANVARTISGLEPLVIRLSGWNLASDNAAEAGPGEWVPLDVGTVRMIGAGAVGGAVAYWLHQWGVGGKWQVIDQDVIRLKNVSKTLAFSTSEAEEVQGYSTMKVQVIERLLPNVTPIDSWYDTWDRQSIARPDIVLPLANERGVRARVASDSETVVLHATTSTQWQSIVHRHIAGRDDCIACRFPDRVPVKMNCSSGSLGTLESSITNRDASLPFVAGASGLMLATMLKRLQLGELASLSWNYCTWHWRTEARFRAAGRYSCASGCGTYLPRDVRRLVNSNGRWAHLDA
jgi:molybdopterin/thiamine biosynthesis adenylyltransferase